MNLKIFPLFIGFLLLASYSAEFRSPSTNAHKYSLYWLVGP